MKIQTLLISKIRRDSGAQFRAEGLDQTHVDNLAKAIRLGSKVPPIIVFFDGVFYWMGGGFHRLEAHIQEGRANIEAEVREGTQLDAKRFGRGDNAEQLARSPKTKRAQVEDALRDPDWANWSNHAIARECKVSPEFVRQMRNELGLSSNVARYAERNGTVYEVNTTNIGAKKKVPQLVELDPSEVTPIWEAPEIKSDWPLSLLTEAGVILDGDKLWTGVNMGIEAGAPLDEKLPMSVDIWPDNTTSEGEGPFYHAEVYWYGGDEYTKTKKPIHYKFLVAQLDGLGVTADHLKQFKWTNRGQLTEAQYKWYLMQRALQLGTLLRAIESMSEINSEAPTVEQWLEENLPLLSKANAGLFINVAALRYPEPESYKDEWPDDSDEAFQDWAELWWSVDAAWMQCDIRQLLPAVGEIVERMKQPITV